MTAPDQRAPWWVIGARVVVAASAVLGLAASSTAVGAIAELHTVAGASRSLGSPQAGLPTATLVALGDSIPEGDDCPECTPFPELVGQSLSVPGAAAVQVENLGVGGWTTDDLLAALAPDEPQALIAADAAAVTVTIGANDFFPSLPAYLDGTCDGASGPLDCFTTLLPHLNATLASILTRLAELRGGRTESVVVTGYWDVFPDGDVALTDFGSTFLADSAALTRQVNTVISAAAARAGASYVDLLPTLRGPDGTGDPTALLADDGEHPSQAGHDTIAAAVAPALREAAFHPGR